MPAGPILTTAAAELQQLCEAHARLCVPGYSSRIVMLPAHLALATWSAAPRGHGCSRAGLGQTERPQRTSGCISWGGLPNKVPGQVADTTEILSRAWRLQARCSPRPLPRARRHCLCTVSSHGPLSLRIPSASQVCPNNPLIRP